VVDGVRVVGHAKGGYKVAVAENDPLWLPCSATRVGDDQSGGRVCFRGALAPFDFPGGQIVQRKQVLLLVGVATDQNDGAHSLRPLLQSCPHP